MIKVSRLADYAVVILSTLSGADELMTAASVSEKSGLPEPTVAKVLKLLAKEDIVVSVRGASGGYKLSRDPQDIHVAEIVMSVDGPISLTACVEGSRDSCDLACSCPVKGRWDDVNMAIRHALESVTLADMLTGKPAFQIQDKEVAHERL